MSTDVKQPATFDVRMGSFGRIHVKFKPAAKPQQCRAPLKKDPPKDSFSKVKLTKGQKRLEAKLTKALGTSLAPLAKLTALMWKTPAFKKHQKAINKLIANPSKKLELAVYVSNLTEFVAHRARLEGKAATYLSETEDAKKTLDAVIEKFTKSTDAAEREFGEKLKAANALLWKVKEGRGKPRPLGVKDPKKGVHIFDLHAQTAAEKRLAEVLDDPRFQRAWNAEYAKTDEYKAIQYEKQRVEDVVKAREVVQGLTSTDPKVRSKALEGLRELLTRVRVGVIRDRAVLKELLKADPDRDKSEQPLITGELDDLDTPMVSVSTIDDDAGANDVGVQRSEIDASAKATDTRMTAEQALQDRVDALVKKLAKADPQAPWIKKLAVRMEKYTRARLVERLKGKADAMRKYNKWDAKLVEDLCADIEKAKDPKKAIKLYREAKYWAQTGLLLANIRELREMSGEVDKQIDQDATTTYWGSRIASLGFYRPERSSNSGWTEKSLEKAERAVLTARYMKMNGLDKDDPKGHYVLIRHAQIYLKGALKQSDIAKKLTTSWQASFMRNMTGLLIIAAATAAAALTGGLAGAIAPELLGTGVGALLVNSAAFTAASAAGNHYLMGQKVTLGSFAEDLFWNTIMFGGFSKLGKLLKARAGIAEAKVLESASFKEAWMRTLKRYGMDEGLAWSRGNALKVFKTVLKKEGSVLAKEAAAFQVFEAGKLTFRHVTGVTAHPVQNYIDELRQLFTPGALLHGMGMLAAIKGVGYATGRVTQGLLSTKPFIKLQVKRINASIVETQRMLVENHKARLKGKALLSDAAEAALWQRQVQHLSILHALGGTKAGDSVKLAYANAQLAAARAEHAGMRDVGRAFKAQDAGAFEKAANEKLSEAERSVVRQETLLVELALRENGRVPDLATRLKIFKINRILKKAGYELTNSGNLQRKGVEAMRAVKGHGEVEMQVLDGELWVRAAEGSAGVIVNGEMHKAGEWVAMLEGDSVVINGKHYARIGGELRPFKVRAESDGPLVVERHKTDGEVRLVVAAGAESIIVQNADGTLSKISRHKNGTAKLDVEQQALALLQHHGIDIAPRLIGRVTSHELAISRVPGRTLENMTTKERSQIPEKAWDRFERDVQRMNDLGIMHNDVHAGNIIYDPKTQTLRLLDFDNSSIGHKSKRDMIDVKQYRALSEQGKPVDNVYRIDIPTPRTKVPVAEIRYDGPAKLDSVAKGEKPSEKMSRAEKAAFAGGLLAMIGGFFLDPMTAMLGLPLLGMVTSRSGAAPKPEGADGAPPSRGHSGPLSFSEAMDVMKAHLDYWFPRDKSLDYREHDIRGRIKLFNGANKALKGDYTAVQPNGYRSADVPFEYRVRNSDGQWETRQGTIRLHYPHNGVSSNTPAIDVTFKAEWAGGQEVTVRFKYGHQDPTKLHRGFGFAHNGTVRSGSEGFKTIEQWFDFVTHRIVPLIVTAKTPSRTTERDSGSTGYVFRGTGEYGKRDGKVIEAVIDPRGREAGTNGRQVYNWVTGYFDTKGSSGSNASPKVQSSSSEPKEAKHRNALQQMRDADKTAYPDGEGVHVFREGKAGAKVLKRAEDSGRAAVEWIGGKGGRARVWEVDPKSEKHEVAEEYRVPFDDFIGTIKESGVKPEGGDFIKHLEFLRDKVLPRLDPDAQMILSFMVQTHLEEFQIIKLNAEFEAPKVFKEDVRRWMRKTVSKLYGVVGEQMKGHEGIIKHDVAFASSKKR